MFFPLHKEIDLSNMRNVFVGGDIHGEYRKLDQALSDLNFDPQRDVFISVGDLTDRGPFSAEFENYISKPWFLRVCGNHDHQPREFLLGYEMEDNLKKNGAQWFLDLSAFERERVASLLEAAPLALTVLTPHGYRVGICHADGYKNWTKMVLAAKAAEGFDPNSANVRTLVNNLTGSRYTIEEVLENPSLNPMDVWVQGIDHVFHGHTPGENVLRVANRSWIDTGACFGGPLTVLNIDAWLSQ